MKFSYLVKPKIPIRALPEHGAITRSKILDLDKDEVIKCLRFGPVYRRFADGELVKATKDNIDSVHVTRLHYKGAVEPRIKVDPINDGALVSNPNTKEEKPESKVIGFGQPINKVEEKVEEKKEEKKVEDPVIDEKKEEEPVVSEPIKVAEKTEKVVEDDKVEEPVEERVEEGKTPQNNNNGQNYSKKNKKH